MTFNTEFWKEYLIQLEVPSTRKIALHLETTGINPTKDKIISIGAVAIENNQILVESSLEIDLNKEEILESLMKLEEDIKNGRVHDYQTVMEEARNRLQKYRDEKQIKKLRKMICRVYSQ